MGIQFSTLFTAQNVRDLLSTDEGIIQAINWCRASSVTHVYIESFRSGYTAPRELLISARDRFLEENFQVSGCITTTNLGKASTGYKSVSCYTDPSTQQQLQEIFEYAASLFDLIMIDDFLFTDCECPECTAAKGDQSWDEYRCQLMTRLSRERILYAARKVNPNVKLIIKYPQWYDRLHLRGYDVINQTRDFDWIWVGTEIRDFDDKRWGGTPQYEAYFNMRWLGELGGKKTGGGWFDPYGTTSCTYVEQAIQTILGDADEALLFCYGSLLRDTGPDNIAAFRKELPGLFRLAELIHRKPISGILAPKPPYSNAGREYFIYDFIGMMGLPLVPTAKLSKDAQAAFLPVQALKDENLVQYMEEMIREGKPLLITDGLADALKEWKGIRELEESGVQILNINGEPKKLYQLSQDQLDAIRKPMLAPLGIEFSAPNRVALYLFGEDTEVIENFNDEQVKVTLSMPKRAAKEGRKVIHVLPSNARVELEDEGEGSFSLVLPPRSLALLM